MNILSYWGEVYKSPEGISGYVGPDETPGSDVFVGGRLKGHVALATLDGYETRRIGTTRMQWTKISCFTKRIWHNVLALRDKLKSMDVRDELHDYAYWGSKRMADCSEISGCPAQETFEWTQNLAVKLWDSNGQTRWFTHFMTLLESDDFPGLGTGRGQGGINSILHEAAHWVSFSDETLENRLYALENNGTDATPFHFEDLLERNFEIVDSFLMRMDVLRMKPQVFSILNQSLAMYDKTVRAEDEVGQAYKYISCIIGSVTYSAKASIGVVYIEWDPNEGGILINGSRSGILERSMSLDNETHTASAYEDIQERIEQWNPTPRVRVSAPAFSVGLGMGKDITLASINVSTSDIVVQNAFFNYLVRIGKVRGDVTLVHFSISTGQPMPQGYLVTVTVGEYYGDVGYLCPQGGEVELAGRFSVSCGYSASVTSGLDIKNNQPGRTNEWPNNIKYLHYSEGVRSTILGSFAEVNRDKPWDADIDFNEGYSQDWDECEDYGYCADVMTHYTKTGYLDNYRSFMPTLEGKMRMDLVMDAEAYTEIDSNSQFLEAARLTKKFSCSVNTLVHILSGLENGVIVKWDAAGSSAEYDILKFYAPDDTGMKTELFGLGGVTMGLNVGNGMPASTYSDIERRKKGLSIDTKAYGVSEAVFNFPLQAEEE